MKALMKSAAGPGLTLTEVGIPEIGHRDVLIRVLRTGICGTDLHIDAWDAWAAGEVETPRVLGHEFVGEVVEVGIDVTEVAARDLVSGEGHLVCGACRNCMAGRRHLCACTIGLGVHVDGAFAEYVRLPASNVWKHNEPIDLDVAAIFDPFGNAVHTALAYPVVGEDVLVTGAGPIGLMAAAVVKHAGARNVVVTDVSPSRLSLARTIGIDYALDVRTNSIAEVQDSLGLKEGFDVGLEMSGRPSALRDMIANMTHGGRIAVLGLPATDVPIAMARVVTHMLTIKGIYGREMFDTWYVMSVLLERGLDIGAVVTNRFGFEQHAEAFETARAGGSGKVVIDWTRRTIA